MLNFKNIKVAVIGDIILDEYYDCDVNRVSPEAPVLILQTNYTKRYSTLGGAGNVAKNCSNLGAYTFLFSFIGTDTIAYELNNHCIENRISFFFIENKKISTIKKTRFKNEQQQIIRIDYENKKQPYFLPIQDQNKLISKFKLYCDKFDLVILSDYNKGTLTDYICETIIELCNKKQIPIFIDPKGLTWSKYEKATCITPNFKEFNQYTTESISIDDTSKKFISIARDILTDFSLDYMLVTRGKTGISFISHDDFFHDYTDAQEVFDVSGAGDTVISTFALTKLLGFSFKDSIKIANLAAKTVIRKIGTQAVLLNELNDEIDKQKEEGIF